MIFCNIKRNRSSWAGSIAKKSIHYNKINLYHLFFRYNNVNFEHGADSSMLMTRASEYALLSLIVIAKATKPLDAETLSKELDISRSFLAKILQSMARQDILNSFKGVNGGFALAKEASDITMLSIICAAEGKSPAVFDCTGSQKVCPSDNASTCQIWSFLNRLQGKIDYFLDGLTLADILEE